MPPFDDKASNYITGHNGRFVNKKCGFICQN